MNNARIRLRIKKVYRKSEKEGKKEVEKCHELGCSNYITKPIEYENFVNAIRQLGLFLAVVQVPVISG